MPDFIPEDIQLKILKHLPVLTLLRSRCVCKWWKQVIDSNSFIQDHLAIQKPYSIVQYKASQYLVTSPCEWYDILPSPIPKRPRLLGTHLGIICLYNQSQHEFLILNPWLHKLMRVGPVGLDFEWYEYDEDEFSYGPSCGFWIDPITKEFKIIMFQLCGHEEPDEELGVDSLILQCGMYSSIRGEWNDIPVRDEFKEYYTKEVAPAVVIDNVGHWTVCYYYRDNKGQEMVGVVVLLFDFVQEIFLDPIDALSIQKGWNLPVVCNHNGILSLVYMDPDNSFDVISRKEGKWVLVHGFCLPHVLEGVMGLSVVEDKKKKKIRILAAITGGQPSFDSNDMVFCVPLMMRLRESNDVVIANDFVASLLLPAAKVYTVV